VIFTFDFLSYSRQTGYLCCTCSAMKDKKGHDGGRCMKQSCDCDEYMVEKAFCLCAYCEHTPLSHGMHLSYLQLLQNFYSYTVVHRLPSFSLFVITAVRGVEAK